MISIHLMGGLGNQLFQLCCVLALGIQTNTPVAILSRYMTNFNGREDRPTYWNNLFAGLTRHLTFVPDWKDIFFIQEPGFHYQYIPISPIMAGKKVMLVGYYQSEKYFKNQFDRLYDLFGFDRLRKDVLDKQSLTAAEMQHTISVHFRLGDYKELTHMHPILPYEYYREALAYLVATQALAFPQVVYYFCEEEDISTVSGMIERLQREFGAATLEFRRANPALEDWEQMLFMSACRHHVIANSSFSWWGAYLNRHPDKVVCYPSVWFGPSAGHNTKDLVPPEWVQIPV